MLVFVAVLALSGCTNISDSSDPGLAKFNAQQSAAEAKVQLATWITPTTSIADARQKLRSQGFTCQAGMPQSPDVRSAMYCNYQPPLPPPPEQRVVTPVAPISWMIVLDSRDGIAVSDFQVSRSPADI